MGYEIGTGTAGQGIRKEVVDNLIKQTAERSYKFKQACAVVTTNAWKNTFFREDPTILAGQTGNVIKGIPRGGNFPQQSVKWEEVSVRIIKHGIEESIPWEDIISGDISVEARTIIKLTEGVTKSVDDDIWNSLTQTNLTESNLRVQSYALTARWNESSAAIIDDIMAAKTLIAVANYDTSDLLCFVSPRDARSIMNYLTAKGAQFPQIATDTARNGTIGTIGAVTFIQSNSVSASYALVCKPKTCATFKQLVPLSNTRIEDPFKNVKYRVVEEGVVELTDPLTCVVIKNTQGGPGL